MKQADAIRLFADANYIQPARASGARTVSIRAGTIRTQMKLKDRMPAVAGALGAKAFEAQYRVRCAERTGPHNGANLTFTFELLP